MAEKPEGMLSAYRVLDLTDEKGLLCGKIFGDLGADVIKIENPCGDAARNTGPFYHDEPNPEKSLFWFALNTNKRGITLNIETVDGREIFKRLAQKADFVIESFPPGYLDKLGLGYFDLEKINPGIILVSITPFGQTGPYRDFKTSDIVAWALGGYLAPFGDPDRPPTRISHHSQAYLHAGADGIMGALTALYHRGSTGEGQQVDVSIMDSVAQCTENLAGVRGVGKRNRKPGGEVAPGTNHRARRVWPCKDGYISWAFGSSRNSPGRPLIDWMDSEGMANDFLKTFDWDKPDFNKTSQQDMDRMEEPAGRFFLSHTKAELLAGAVKHHVMLYPVSTPADMLENPQLIARDFWVKVEHPELGATLTYPGPFGCASETPMKINRRAPLIGEHNREIYEDELGFSREKLMILQQAGVI